MAELFQAASYAAMSMGAVCLPTQRADQGAILFDHAAGDSCAAATQRRRSVRIIIAARMDHDRAPANLFHRKMRSGGSPGRIAAAINHQHLQVAAMAGGAERSQMLFGVGRIVVPAGGEACGRFALIHPGPAVALIMNMKPVLSRRQP